MINKLLHTPGTLTKAGILFLCMYTGLLMHLPFFGDHVTLISAPANWFYTNDLSTIWLPNNLDTGHPVFYPYVTALIWMLLGHSLWVSHTITLLAGLILLSQFTQYVKNIQKPEIQSIAIILLLVNPVFLAQMANMSIDILLVAMLFMGINAIRTGNNKRLILACIVLTIISLRGFIGVTALILYDAQLHKTRLPQFISRIKIYLIALVPVSVYFIAHYTHFGWWLIPENGNWSQDRSWSNLSNLGAKIFEFGFRTIEFGMLLPVILLVFSFTVRFKATLRNHHALLSLILLGCLAVFVLPFQNPVLIRYLLPFHLMVLIFFSEFLYAAMQGLWRKLCFTITLLLCLLQHFVVYPQMQRSLFEYSWGDGSLAHLSYFGFRAEAKQYVTAEGIAPASVYTSFPDYKKFADTDLSNDTLYYHKLESSQLKCYPYIIYSNIMNEVPKQLELEIKTSFIREKTWYQYPVEYILFRNPVIPVDSCR